MKLTILLAVVALAAAEYKSYDGYRVVRTQQLSDAQFKSLHELMLSDTTFDFWKEPMVGRSADIMTAAEHLQSLQEILAENDIHYSFMVEDVGEMMRESRSMKGKRILNKPGLRFDWDDYYGHDEINQFIDDIAAGDNGVETVSIGSTYEGRDMRVIKIEKAGAGKPSVWIEGGIHAREWIAPAMATYLINEIMNSAYVNDINFHILPVANPDGYEYSRSNDRYWRKNRSPQHGNCAGVDLNRNWGFHFAESGVSHDPCSEVYCGESAFSENESQNIKNYVEKMSPTPVLGHCLHSYSQLWLWPYGYDYNAYPENYQEIRQLAQDASDALYQIHGTYFDPINSADLYPAAGASDDWYKGSLGTRYSFTTELRDTGFWGFELPPNQIIPSGEELWAGMKVVFDKVIADGK